MNPSRNGPCPCGSGRKYKHCHLRSQVEGSQAGRALGGGGPEEVSAADSLRLARQQLESGNLVYAEVLCQTVPETDAAFAESRYMLALVAMRAGKPGLAADYAAAALANAPGHPQYTELLFSALVGGTRYTEAKGVAETLLGQSPNVANAHNNLGMVLQLLEQFVDAENSFRAAIALDSGNARFHSNLGSALSKQRRHEESIDALQTALRLDPKLHDIRLTLSIYESERHNYQAAIEHGRYMLSCNFLPHIIWHNLGNAQFRLNRVDEAIASYRNALRENQDATGHTLSAILFTSSQRAEASAAGMLQLHRSFGATFDPLGRLGPSFDGRDRDPERRLRIGFVSADFRAHVVMSFFEPVVDHLNRQALEIFCYANVGFPDGVTDRLQAKVDHWHNIWGVSDDAVAAQIDKDGIDILIDLSGHTAFHRLTLFARKSAPIQASWIGYPGSTGLAAMDYYLADRHFLPAGQFDDQFTEKLVQLPASAPFTPSSLAPDVNALPAQRNGYVTLGSFNSMSKLSRSVVALWSELLRALPQARMVLGAVPKDGQETLKRWFVEEGIHAERLRFHAMLPMPEYLALHHDVDFCLDTFPYNGGTTTWHALWMGVPTLTLAGETASGRSGASILGHMELPDFVAHSKEEFVAHGVQWAGRVEELAQIRTGLRTRVQASPAGQPQLIAASVEQALRTMWRTWCAGAPTLSFEVSLGDLPKSE